jgi:hypothetical protein
MLNELGVMKEYYPQALFILFFFYVVFVAVAAIEATLNYLQIHSKRASLKLKLAILITTNCLIFLLFLFNLQECSSMEQFTL